MDRHPAGEAARLLAAQRRISEQGIGESRPRERVSGLVRIASVEEHLAAHGRPLALPEAVALTGWPKPTVHRISTDLWYPWLSGYRRPLFWNEWWHMVDIDNTRRPAK